MSKKFKSQDHFRYSRLGKRWRRPVGLQSKLRLGKGGSGMRPAAGRGTPAAMKNKMQGVDYFIASNAADLESAGGRALLIASGVGGRKTAEIAAAAEKLGLRVLNMKKVKRARKISKRVEKKKISKEKKKEAEAKTAEKQTAEEAKPFEDHGQKSPQASGNE